MRVRVVIVLCGPPGAGKTTAARASGLEVYDRDDPQWTSEAHFSAALGNLGRDPDARAVVIRWAPRSRDRADVCAQVNATACYLLTEDRDTLARRINARNRPDAPGTLAGIRRWFEAYDDRDHVPAFPGWAPALGRRTSREW